VQWFRGGLVFKAHRLVHHSTLGLRVIKKKKRVYRSGSGGRAARGWRKGLRLAPRRDADRHLIGGQLEISPAVSGFSGFTESRCRANMARVSQSSQGQILALAFKNKSSKPVNFLPLRSTEEYRDTSLIRNSPPPLGPPWGPRHSPAVGS